MFVARFLLFPCRYALKYGSFALPTTCVGVGINLLTRFTEQFFLDVTTLRRISSNFLVAMGSGMLVFAIHNMGMINNIRYERYPCEACVVLKAGLLGATVGAIFPSFTALLVAQSSAHMRMSYSLPTLSEGKWNFVKNTARAFGSHWFAQRRAIGAFAVAQCLLFQTVVFAEMQSAKKLNRRIAAAMQKQSSTTKPMHS